MPFRLSVYFFLFTVLAPSQPAAKEKEEKVSGYAEWRIDDVIIVDGQRVRPGEKLKFKGDDEARDYESIPLGYEVEAKGRRLPDGSLLAREIKAKPNGSAWFEKDVIAATNAAEKGFLEAQHVFLPAGDGKVQDMGELVDSGPRYERVRAIFDRLLPPYIEPSAVRIYVIENEQWNAFAMGNLSFYVHSALIEDLDDDELAVILGHELAHATHEHSRRQAKKAMWAGMVGTVAQVAAEELDSAAARGAVSALTVLGHMAWVNGYSRDLEDQADRVGLRYMHAGGYDVRDGPVLWRKFAARYPDQNRVANFFFGGHPQSMARAANLERQIALNYRDAVPSGPALAAEPVAIDSAETLAAAPTPPAPPVPGGLDLAAPARAPASDPRLEKIKNGMTALQVLDVLGEPVEVFTDETRNMWKYHEFIVVFEEARVTEIQLL